VGHSDVQRSHLEVYFIYEMVIPIFTLHYNTGIIIMDIYKSFLNKFLTSIVFIATFGFTQTTDLFFSEYIEGSSYNKALEIFNPSDNTVDLANYRIAWATNGNGWEYWHTFPMGAILDSDEVWVITTDQADASLQAVADEVLSFPSVTHHTGDDARGLEKTTDSGTTWTLIDIIGDPDEWLRWDVAGVSEATYNHTLVRKFTVTSGNTDWSASAEVPQRIILSGLYLTKTILANLVFT